MDCICLIWLAWLTYLHSHLHGGVGEQDKVGTIVKRAIKKKRLSIMTTICGVCGVSLTTTALCLGYKIPIEDSGDLDGELNPIVS
jgi:propanediol utilization protein